MKAGLCRDDLVNMFAEALTNESYKGTYNATAPNPVRMSDLCASLGSVLGRPSWLPVPDFAIQVSKAPCLQGTSDCMHCETQVDPGNQA